MIQDAELNLATEQSLLAMDAGDFLASTFDLDTSPLATGNAGRDLGTGHRLDGYVEVTTSCAGATAILELMLVSDGVQNGQDVNSNVHWSSGARPVAFWSVGTTIKFRLDTGPSSAPWLRYVAFMWKLTVADFTAGAMTCKLTPATSVRQNAGDFAYGTQFV
jgi:hypothetical protein